MKKLNNKAIDEIYKLLQKVIEIKEVMNKIGICYHSDTWTAFKSKDNRYNELDYENILNWNKEDFKKLDFIDKIDYFNVGGSVSINDHIIDEPKELALAKGNFVLSLLTKILKEFNAQYFELTVFDNGLEENCGWERFMGIRAKPILKKCIDQKYIKLNLNMYEIAELMRTDFKIRILDVDNDNIYFDMCEDEDKIYEVFKLITGLEDFYFYNPKDHGESYYCISIEDDYRIRLSYILEFGGNKELNEMSALELNNYDDACDWIISSLNCDSDYYKTNIDIPHIVTLEYYNDNDNSKNFHAQTMFIIETNNKIRTNIKKDEYYNIVDIIESSLTVVSKIIDKHYKVI